MRFILRIGVLLIGICVLGMSVSVAIARRESPQPQLAMTVLTTDYHQNELQYDLFLVHAESGFRRRVTHGNGMPDYVEWTDDGKWLSFYEGATYGSGQFLRMDWVGHHQQTVASEGSWFSRQAPSSPDGQWKVWIGLDRTLYLYNPQQGTDALIDEFGEHPQGIRSSQRVGWSHDSRWLYITDIWRYVGDRFMGPDNHIIDTDYFIFRIDLERESASLIASQRAAFLQTVDIGDEWIIYSQGTLEGRSIWKIRVDGSDLALVKYTQSFSPNYSVFWATPDNAVILVEEHTVQGLTRVVFRRIESSPEEDRLLTFSGVSTFQFIRHFAWSQDRSYLAFVGQTLQDEQLLVVMTLDGVILYIERVELCSEIAPIWDQDNLITIEKDGEKCRLKQTALRDLSFSIIDTFPNDFTAINVIETMQPAWLKVDKGNMSTLIALDGSKTIEIEANPDGNIVAWSWLPIQSHSFRLAVGLGFLTFVVSCLNFVWSSSISEI